MNRIASIDVFRAITMFLMIFVNDFWTLTGVPPWLLHAEMQEDRLGFSDVIFPVFLVIVGMSLPFAIQNRRKKGETNQQITRHIIERTLALVVMGFFLVNYEYLDANSLPFEKVWVGSFLVVCFFLLWNSYPKSFQYALWLKILGLAGLVVFAFLYPGGISALKPYWWGILGLIGWSYFCAAFAYLWTGNNIKRLIAVTVAFLILSILGFMGVLNTFRFISTYVWVVSNGSLPFLVMLGVLSSVIYQNKTFSNYALALSILGIGLIALGFVFRPFWGISKIMATPAWVCICGGIAYASYAILYQIIDIQKKTAWSNWLKAGGVATLTCYLIPYFWYTGRSALGLRLPEALLNYPLGLISALLVSFIIFQITALLLKGNIKLKV